MIIKITLSVLFVSVCFQLYFWLQGQPFRFDFFKKQQQRKPMPAIQVVFESEEAVNVCGENKPFVTHLVEINEDLEFTEWEVQINK